MDVRHMAMSKLKQCGFPTGTATVVRTWFWKTNLWTRSKTQRKTSSRLTYWTQAVFTVSQKPGR
ncbi:hypothetical protein EYF80_053722 [Liparis tanakae]|uniref:Uncharacterized protein n=1 Tax=Liparis tanakae TaxID=230148 RepID=A0A4Z2F4G1_9TELE|nr:hypothetical protein EYF80_053722 [Liparis tanakae]